MPFARPSLTDLIFQVKSDLRARLSLAGPLVRRAMADALSTVWAGAVHMLHGHLDWSSRQLFVSTAEEAALLSIGSFYGVARVPASFALGSVIATGTNGSIIPSGALLSISGVEYSVTATRTIAGGTATVPIQSVTAGAAATLAAGVTLTFESPVTGVTAATTVATGGIVGFDQESVEHYRARLTAFRQQPPEGGDAADYEAWALDVAGVTRAWVYPTEDGLGTVTVRFVEDGNASSIFPNAAAIAAVQAHLAEERPITAEVTAKASSALALNFTLHIEPDTAELRAAVQSELADLLYRDAEPGDGIGRGTIRLSRMRTAIGVVDGLDDYAMISPASDVVPTLGALLQMGTLTWV